MNEDQNMTTTKRALTVNQDTKRYGTFAEIGAGQEVARHFFRVGLASNTIAKTMSAYDMTFSDAIYGKGHRYVSAARLSKMLDHEYELLTQRLHKNRGENSLFFVFANTVATSSYKNKRVCHGWMGVRFQITPEGPPNDVILHVNMKDPQRLQQHEALGILGVNLLFSAFYRHSSEKKFVTSLIKNIGLQRMEIDIIDLKAPQLDHLQSPLLNLELLVQGVAQGILFSASGSIEQPSDTFYQVPLLVHRGQFNPMTNIQLELIEKGGEQFCKDDPSFKKNLGIILEISMYHQKRDFNDYLRRVEMINSLGHHALISNFNLPYELKNYLRHHTANKLAIILGAFEIVDIFNESSYESLKGGILSGLGKLFDDQTQLYVFQNPSQLALSDTWKLDLRLMSLYKYLTSSDLIKRIPIRYGGESLSLQCEDIQGMIAAQDPNWEQKVPQQICELIKKHGLFDYKSKK